MKWMFVFLFVTFVDVNFGKNLPPDFPKCKRDDPNLNECLKQAIQISLPKLDNGIPSLKVPPLQPLYVPGITIGEGNGAVHVVQNYKNYNLYDMGRAKVHRVEAKINPNGLDLIVETSVREMRFEADYSFNGRILLLPIVGNGKCTVTLQNCNATFTLHADTFDKKGTKYLKVTEFILKFNPEKVIYNFENLFNGDERLGTEMNKVLNENWKEVYDDMKEQYEVAMQTIFADYTNKVFTQVPYDDLI